MERRSPLVLVVLTALATMALSSANAYAEEAAATADSSATIASDTVPAATLEETAPSGDTVEEATPTDPPETTAAPVAPAVDPLGSAAAPATDPAPPPAATPEPAAPPAPPAAAPPHQAAPVASATDTPLVSAPAGPSARSAGATRRPATGVQSPSPPDVSLPGVVRDLRTLQGDVEDIARQLARGGTPPPGRLNRLRSSLERLAPVLLALNARGDGLLGAGEGTRRLLHRVRARLGTAQVATAGLIVALRRSGLQGPAALALIRELESFGALGHGLDLTPGPILPAPTAAPVVPARPAVVLARTSSSSPNEPSVARPPAGAAPRAGDAPKGTSGHSPAPWSFAGGSSSASASAALSVAGIAALAALLLALALPRLLTRLQLPPGRGHAVALVLALERPD
jgi:hypothetical protein